MSTSAAPAATLPATRRYPRSVLIALGSIPVLVIGQFAFLAIVPVVLVLVRSLRDERLRAIRTWSIALAGTYATPLVIWLVRPNGAQSLSKDIHPLFVALIVVATAAVWARLYVRNTRS